MRERNEITDLFRSRLSDAKMTVRDGFWEQLEKDLAPVAPAVKEKDVRDGSRSSADVVNKRRYLFLSPKFYSVASVAAIVLILGAASAAFWYFSPKDEIQEAFTQVASLTPEGNLNGDVVQENFPSIHEAPLVAKNPGVKPTSGSAILAEQVTDDEETVSVHVSITISQRVYGQKTNGGNGYEHRSSVAGNYLTSSEGEKNTNATSDTQSVSETEKQDVTSPSVPRNWAIKASVGTSLPKGEYDMPLMAGITIERHIDKHLSLETGVQYTRLPAANTLHVLGIPVKLNVMLASASKFDFYAMVGGTAEKCIAGASDNSFRAEPVQLSVLGGIGVRYKMNDRFALFAEPYISHYFSTDSQTKTLRTEQSTNMNLLCGLRMTY